MKSDYEIVIIGSGPAGLSAAAHAAELGVAHVLLEAESHLSNTIFKYQKGKHVMAEPGILPLRSPLKFDAGKREVVLDAWNEGLKEHKVNVKYTPKGQMEIPILHVAKPGDCGMKGGWYYDNPNQPTKIIMCPSTCDTLKKDSTGKVDVLFGCETQIKPPE